MMGWFRAQQFVASRCDRDSESSTTEDTEAQRHGEHGRLEFDAAPRSGERGVQTDERTTRDAKGVARSFVHAGSGGPLRGPPASNTGVDDPLVTFVTFVFFVYFVMKDLRSSVSSVVKLLSVVMLQRWQVGQ